MTKEVFQVAELFAGVGGFRLGLEAARHPEAKFRVTFSNQWEPGAKRQHASECYMTHFGSQGHVNEDLAKYLDWAIDGNAELGEEYRVSLPNKIDLLVGGFPCQDYSVAKPLSHSQGLQGKKGVLWWEINRLLERKRPTYVLLENVDRLLKSPAGSRGKDFAIILSCLARLGYVVQWRVVNAAEYGFPQRRRRVFILAERRATKRFTDEAAFKVLTKTGTMARALPSVGTIDELRRVEVISDPFAQTSEYNNGKVTHWGNAGVLVGGQAWTLDLDSAYKGPRATLGDVVQHGVRISREFFLEESSLNTWKYLKGAKRETRKVKSTGFGYVYTEGSVEYPDPLTRPARTILTSEGGTSPSRSKHVIKTKSGRLRRLTPIELERLQGFPDNWTATYADGDPIPDTKRAFFMGNALVVGLVQRVGKELLRNASARSSTLGV
jgi:DNA (cytosine-5)-methyltransferase 1